MSRCRNIDVCVYTLRNDGLLEFAFIVQFEKIACPERKGHTLIVFLQMIVHLRQHQGCQLSFREGLIFIECFAEEAKSVCKSEYGLRGKRLKTPVRKVTYIWPTDPATSVHKVSMSSFKVCKAKTLSSGSVSDRKPRTPEAEVRPGMVNLES